MPKMGNANENKIRDGVKGVRERMCSTSTKGAKKWKLNCFYYNNVGL